MPCKIIKKIKNCVPKIIGRKHFIIINFVVIKVQNAIWGIIISIFLRPLDFLVFWPLKKEIFVNMEHVYRDRVLKVLWKSENQGGEGQIILGIIML